MKKSRCVSAIMVFILLLLATAMLELAQPSPAVGNPHQGLALDPRSLELSAWLFEEGANEMEEDYGYALGAESAIEAIHLAPSGYVAEQFNTRFAVPAPVPEPDTYALLLAGTGVMGMGLRRRFQKITANPI